MIPERSPPALSGRTTVAILTWLDVHGPATAEVVAIACDLETSSVRGRLVMLGRQGSVSSQPNDDPRARRVYSVTDEGRDRAGISDARRAGSA